MKWDLVFRSAIKKYRHLLNGKGARIADLEANEIHPSPSPPQKSFVTTDTEIVRMIANVWVESETKAKESDIIMNEGKGNSLISNRERNISNTHCILNLVIFVASTLRRSMKEISSIKIERWKNWE